MGSNWGWTNMRAVAAVGHAGTGCHSGCARIADYTNRSTATPFARIPACHSTAARGSSPRASPARPTAPCCAPSASATTISRNRSSAWPTATRTMNPCNAGIQPLVDRAMAALEAAGAKPQVFGVPTVTDGIGMGTEGDEVLAGVARGDRRRHRDLGQRPGDGRRAGRRRLRQEHAGRHDGDGAHERARHLRLRRHHQAGQLEGPGPHHRLARSRRSAPSPPAR